ncbi:ABC transporter ATP-binding protein [Brevibacillus ruminantium]|uniref:ABC transporter ATP-binding protein n=1 Tax=Brevibacillus ruminantium TaxID=2950604 RepID=A0ABY4WCC3_9BACL|nr:ABC transporter ATP-binding protein [Brevibacillus ruminantium]USG64827.1 ABC transporter ATP-binding protein [Brevibacillus ruminantium]
MSFCEIKELSFYYPKAKEKTIQDFTLTISQGEIVGILGQSGSGKSTLLRLISGLEEPAGGSITIAGKTVVDGQRFVEPEERGVGMVFQDYALFPHLTVAQNIVFGLHRLSRKERKQRLAEMLELVQLTGFENRYPHELSGGQQQRVALARALAPKPSVLLMDEPFSNLDADLKERIREELRDILKLAQITCIFVTHDKEDVKAICDRTVVMGRGA